MSSPITTHVLDTARGRPAAGIDIVLEIASVDGGLDGDAAHEFDAIGSGTTDSDGRAGDLLPPEHILAAGVYRIVFHVGPYLEELGDAGFFPRVPIIFRVVEPTQHYHVPLLLSPYGYSTYRGS